MARSEFPEKFTEHGKELNRVSDFDPRQLNPRDEQKFRLIEKQKETEHKKIVADKDRYRDQRIEKKWIVGSAKRSANRHEERDHTKEEVSA